MQRVVDQLLDYDRRPLAGLVTGLRDKFLLGKEIEEAAGPEGGALKLRCVAATHRSHPSLHRGPRPALRADPQAHR